MILIINNSKVAPEAKAVTGFRGINPQAFHANGHTFHGPLTALFFPLLVVKQNLPERLC
jgi:hypothetical protein